MSKLKISANHCESARPAQQRSAIMKDLVKVETALARLTHAVREGGSPATFEGEGRYG